jgi:ferric-dicitrate binding protein FerR (iron transport regulator)
MSAASSPPDDSALRAIAAQWTIRRDRGLSASESIDYELWLAADPRHAAAMQRSAAAWSLLDRIPESAATPVLAAAPSGAARSSSAPSRQVGALEVRKRARLNPNFGYANDPPIAAAAD